MEGRGRVVVLCHMEEEGEVCRLDWKRKEGVGQRGGREQDEEKGRMLSVSFIPKESQVGGGGRGSRFGLSF